MERVVLHSDANAFFATASRLYMPQLRNLPIAVCGDPKLRHGIILAKSQEAKKYQIETGEPIFKALQKCPSLVLVAADFDLYQHISRQLHRIYLSYTDRVQAFGIDECWLDISQRGRTIEDGVRIADEIRQRVREEIGVTVSIGVSYNKIFAKLGSDYKKPDATTTITPDNFKQIVWPLPAKDLLYVGSATAEKLRSFYVKTIGGIAQMDTDAIYHKLGKIGLMLQAFALGLDVTNVTRATYESPIKSVGNSNTLPHDVNDSDEAAAAFYMIAESVGARMRENGFRTRCVSISVRTTDLVSYSCQRTLKRPTLLTADIAKTAIALYEERYATKAPFRSLGINCSSLSPAECPEQLDMFLDAEARLRRETLERAMDDLRKRFGHQVIQRGVVLTDKAFAMLNPKDGNTVHPPAFLRGAG